MPLLPGDCFTQAARSGAALARFTPELDADVLFRPRVKTLGACCTFGKGNTLTSQSLPLIAACTALTGSAEITFSLDAVKSTTADASFERGRALSNIDGRRLRLPALRLNGSLGPASTIRTLSGGQIPTANSEVPIINIGLRRFVPKVRIVQALLLDRAPLAVHGYELLKGLQHANSRG
jgi:hypothetical protein